LRSRVGDDFFGRLAPLREHLKKSSLTLLLSIPPRPPVHSVAAQCQTTRATRAMLPPITSAASSPVIPVACSAVESTRQDAIGGYVLRVSAGSEPAAFVPHYVPS